MKQELNKRSDNYLGNPAMLTGEALLEPCSNCTETIHFAFKDKTHTFSIGLTTVLKCLRFAEEHGEIPELPNEWWISIINKYRLSE